MLRYLLSHRVDQIVTTVSQSPKANGNEQPAPKRKKS